MKIVIDSVPISKSVLSVKAFREVATIGLKDAMELYERVSKRGAIEVDFKLKKGPIESLMILKEVGIIAHIVRAQYIQETRDLLLRAIHLAIGAEDDEMLVRLANVLLSTNRGETL